MRLSEKQFEKNWKDYEKQLEHFLLDKADFKDWIQRKDDGGNIFWTNNTTLKNQIEHPGRKIFDINRKILKQKAKGDLEKALEEQEEKKILLLEAMLSLKNKISVECAAKRVDSALMTHR